MRKFGEIRSEYTLIHICAGFGHIECLKIALKENPEWINDQKNRNETSPLHVAAFYECADAMNILLENGANYELTDIRGKTIMDFPWVQDNMEKGIIVHPNFLHDIKEPV